MEALEKQRIKEIQQELEKNNTEKCRLLSELFALCGIETEVLAVRPIDKAQTLKALQDLLHKP